jgi:RNA polymerase sigma-54 factor
MKPKLDIRLSQKLIMTPQLQQAIKLLQLTRFELSQMISQELLVNPLLEEPSLEPDESEESVTENNQETESETNADNETGADTETEEFKNQWEEYLEDEQENSRNMNMAKADLEDFPSYERTLTRPTTLTEHLLNQLRLSKTTIQDYNIGSLIIGNIDENGYLTASVEEIAKSLEVPVETIEPVLRLVQSFDPLGVGARDLKECLLIQIHERGIEDPIVRSIISTYLGEIENKKYEKIARSLKTTVEHILKGVKIIEGLEPKPGRPFFEDEAQIIVPDVYVVKSKGQYQVVLNDDGLPRLRINPFYRKMLTSKDALASPVHNYLKEHFKSAIRFIRSIEQRNRTIYKVAQSIVKLQQDFLDNGIAYLKPLVLRQVAEDIAMHESTVSRVTTGKYMHTPQGIFELKFFFNSSISMGGEQPSELSSVTVREMIRQIIVQEGSLHPLRDQEIVELLKKRNIAIARRTIAKYRAELKIPSAGRRKRYAQ